MNKKEASLLSPGLLAYIGDSVYELQARKYLLLEKGYRKNHQIHQQTVKLVNATFQANALRDIEEKLTDEEKSIVRRGRNTKSGSVPANTDVIDYRLSTGMEALFGYHYLSGNKERLSQIWGFIIGSLKDNQ